MLFISGFLFLGSCNKPYLLSEAGASYKIDGTQLQFSGKFDQSHFDSITGRWYGCYYFDPRGTGFYNFIAEDGVNGMSIQIFAPAGLPIGTYTEGQVNAFFTVKGVPYLTGQITLNIVRNHNDVIDGNFTARVGDFSGNIKTITDGYFYNYNKRP